MQADIHAVWHIYVLALSHSYTHRHVCLVVIKLLNRHKNVMVSLFLSHTQLDYDHTSKSVRLLQHTVVPTTVQTHYSRVVKMLLNDVGFEPVFTVVL